MADIDVERKERSIWPWILGAIAIVLLIWLLAGLLDDDDEIEEIPVTPVGVVDEADPEPAALEFPPPPAATDTTPIPVTVIVAGPASYLGQPVVGTGTVGEVVSDRGFWLEQDGQRIFALIARTPQMEDAVDVNPGQVVQVAGIVYDSATAEQIPGGLEDDARELVADQPAFLYVPAQNVLLLGPGQE